MARTGSIGSQKLSRRGAAGRVRWRHRFRQQVQDSGSAHELTRSPVGAVDVIGDPDVEQVHQIGGKIGIRAALLAQLQAGNHAAQLVVLFHVLGGLGIAGLHEQHLLAAAVLKGMMLQRIKDAAKNLPAGSSLDGAMQAIDQGDQLLVILVELLDTHAQILRPKQQHRVFLLN
jgi:hypothetical protein